MQFVTVLALFAPFTAALQLGVPAVSTPRAAVSMVARDTKIPSKMVWTDMAPVSECKPNTVTAGFKYGIEVAFACDAKGNLYGFSNKMPPTGQPTTFGQIVDDLIVEPLTGTQYKLKTGKQTGKWCPYPVGLIIGRLTSPQDLETFQVRKNGKNVQALINVNAKAQFEQKYWRGVLDSQGKVDGGYY